MKNCILFFTLVFSMTLSSAQVITRSTSSSSNISVSVSTSNNNYSYSAKFDKDKTVAAKKVLLARLGKPFEETDRSSIWKGIGYNVSIRQGIVKMEMNNEEVTKSFQIKLEDLGDEISESIGSLKVPEPPRMN